MPTAPTSSTDPLLETHVFWTRYKAPILLGLALIVLGFGGYGAYRFYSDRREASAATLLANAKDAPGYQRVIADYPRTGAAASAYLFLAAQQRDKHQFTEANETLQKFIGAQPKHQLVTTAKMAIAANLESMGKPTEALDMYRRIASDYSQNFNAPLALLAQVQLLKTSGQTEEARRVCETLLTQYRDSYASTEASQYLRTLKPKPSAPTPAAPGPQNAPGQVPASSLAASPQSSATPKP